MQTHFDRGAQRLGAFIHQEGAPHTLDRRRHGGKVDGHLVGKPVRVMTLIFTRHHRGVPAAEAPEGMSHQTAGTIGIVPGDVYGR